jgi:hypothetical protein
VALFENRQHLTVAKFIDKNSLFSPKEEIPHLVAGIAFYKSWPECH